MKFRILSPVLDLWGFPWGLAGRGWDLGSSHVFHIAAIEQERIFGANGRVCVCTNNMTSGVT